MQSAAVEVQVEEFHVQHAAEFFAHAAHRSEVMKAERLMQPQARHALGRDSCEQYRDAGITRLFNERCEQGAADTVASTIQVYIRADLRCACICTAIGPGRNCSPAQDGIVNASDQHRVFRMLMFFEPREPRVFRIKLSIERGRPEKDFLIVNCEDLRQVFETTDSNSHAASITPSSDEQVVGWRRRKGCGPRLRVVHCVSKCAKSQRLMTDLIAFTDGGCRGNPGTGAWAFALVDPRTRKALERTGGERETTNNRMEMQAAIEALGAVKSTRRAVLVFSDSKYLIGCCTKWMASWKANGWKRKGDPLKNLDLLRALDELLTSRTVRFQWIPGHAGHAGNEHVDALANQAMDRIACGANPAHERRFEWTAAL